MDIRCLKTHYKKKKSDSQDQSIVNAFVAKYLVAAVGRDVFSVAINLFGSGWSGLWTGKNGTKYLCPVRTGEVGTYS